MRRKELRKLNFPDADQVRRKMGERVAQARIRKELTLREVKERTGISTSQIQNIEKGRNMASLPVWIVLCRALGIAPDLA